MGKIKLKSITVDTVNGKMQKYAFKTDSVKIYNGTTVNIYNNVILCIAGNVGEGYDLILHPALSDKENYEYIKQVKSVS